MTAFAISELSWTELLEDLKRSGLEVPPKLAVGDGGLGTFGRRCRRCIRRRANNAVGCTRRRTCSTSCPRVCRVEIAKSALNTTFIWPRAEQPAEGALDHFAGLYEVKYPKAVACLEKDREVLLTFYDFPAEHWGHLRTTNPIESTFATVRLRQRRTKGCGSREASLTMVLHVGPFAIGVSGGPRSAQPPLGKLMVHVLEAERNARLREPIEAGPAATRPAVTTPCGFDIIPTLSTRPQWFPCGPLLASHLTWFFPGLFLLCSRPWLLTTAAEGGLEPAPASRFRGAYPHRSSSYTLRGPCGPLCARGAQSSA